MKVRSRKDAHPKAPKRISIFVNKGRKEKLCKSVKVRLQNFNEKFIRILKTVKSQSDQTALASDRYTSFNLSTILSADKTGALHNFNKSQRFL